VHESALYKPRSPRERFIFCVLDLACGNLFHDLAWISNWSTNRYGHVFCFLWLYV